MPRRYTGPAYPAVGKADAAPGILRSLKARLPKLPAMGSATPGTLSTPSFGAAAVGSALGGATRNVLGNLPQVKAPTLTPARQPAATPPSAPAPPDWLNPLSQAQIQQNVSKQVSALFDPQIAAISTMITQRQKAGDEAIRAMTNQLAGQMSGYTQAVKGIYAGAESQQATLNAALGQALSGQTGALSSELASGLAQAGQVTAPADALRAFGTGLAGTQSALGSADLSGLIAKSAAAQEYGAALPQIARLGGLQTMRDFHDQLAQQEAEQTAQLRSQIPGTIQSMLTAAQGQEWNKAVERRRELEWQAGQTRQAQIDKDNRAKAAAKGNLDVYNAQAKTADTMTKQGDWVWSVKPNGQIYNTGRHSKSYLDRVGRGNIARLKAVETEAGIVSREGIAAAGRASREGIAAGQLAAGERRESRLTKQAATARADRWDQDLSDAHKYRIYKGAPVWKNEKGEMQLEPDPAAPGELRPVATPQPGWKLDYYAGYKGDPNDPSVAVKVTAPPKKPTPSFSRGPVTKDGYLTVLDNHTGQVTKTNVFIGTKPDPKKTAEKWRMTTNDKGEVVFIDPVTKKIWNTGQKGKVGGSTGASTPVDKANAIIARIATRNSKRTGRYAMRPSQSVFDIDAEGEPILKRTRVGDKYVKNYYATIHEAEAEVHDILTRAGLTPSEITEAVQKIVNPMYPAGTGGRPPSALQAGAKAAAKVQPGGRSVVVRPPKPKPKPRRRGNPVQKFITPKYSR